jgi:putative ABC transport system permease protein
LALSVLERTREIGLLRALGLTRRQLRSAVRIESALIAVLGGLFGLVGGYLLGAMFQRAALRTGLLDAAVPLGQVALALGRWRPPVYWPHPSRPGEQPGPTH